MQKKDKKDNDSKEVNENEFLKAWLNSSEVKQRPLEEENMVNELGNKDFMETSVPVFTRKMKKKITILYCPYRSLDVFCDNYVFM